MSKKETQEVSWRYAKKVLSKKPIKPMQYPDIIARAFEAGFKKASKIKNKVSNE